jgi:hypothetical protein
LHGHLEMAAVSWNRSKLPGLREDNYRITSKGTRSYNCIAWAAGDDTRWWWPDIEGNYYWPPDAPRSRTLLSFSTAFQSLGYSTCSNGIFVKGLEKIAIYGLELPMGVICPTHAARLIPSGKWTSKLGVYEDIEHDSEHDVSGPEYGSVVMYLSRPCRESP